MPDKKITLRELLKDRILLRVYFVWFIRRIVPIIIFQVVVLALALQLFAQNVFVAHVFSNVALVAGQGYWAVLWYLLASFLHTRPLVQLAILVLFGVVALLIRDAIRAVIAYHAMWIRKGSDEGSAS
ncbi:hypothetical protein KGO95_02470 [Patescibacteria group bacterium]|nr:hypothetical protein [Patescibacteria group bacterium]